MTELILRKAAELKAPQITRRDITTSLSDIRVPRELEGIVMPDHCYRKIGYSRRREYIDCPTCVPSLYNLGIAQIQTESKKMSVMECQTPKRIMKETPIQTLSKCEFCHQHIQLPITVGAHVPSTHCLQHPQWNYPTVVQFLRGDTSGSCCPKCKCAEDKIKQLQQQSQQLKYTRSLMSKVKSPHKMSETQQITKVESGSSITKLRHPTTHAYISSFYEPDKKMQTAPDIDYKQKMAAIEMKKGIREDIDQKIAGKTKIKLAKTKESDIFEKILGHENIKERHKDSMKGSEEKTIRGKKIERSKGGGEHSARINQEFRGVMEQESPNLKESSIDMSRMLSTPLSSRTKSRTLLHLKSNKVDPITDANVFVINEDCSPERMASRTILDNQNIQGSEHSARTGTPNPIIERQLNAACSLYRPQKSLTPTSDNSSYYIVFKDRKGRHFCEFCAPLKSRKITSRFEGTDSRKLRCANCRLHFRDRGIKTKSDTYPKYSRLQKQMASPTTT
ncbi:PREDICTED: uncharacterized protein LOC108753471 isoform X2 [Trachymyrmex septentrionalis]|nr:PREDICTED: uncharacterized protein LOC108753471 isoform X2 [Trachymyrmex septentrionalis]